MSAITDRHDSDGSRAPGAAPGGTDPTGVDATGGVVAGIAGHQRYRFDVWGDALNTAARMTGYGNPGTANMTHDAWLQVRDDREGRMVGR